MTKEQLETLGLDAEQIKEVFKLNGIAVENAKGDLNTKETELATTKKLLEDANKEIESFKGLDVEAIKAKADKYKEDYEALEKQSKEELETLQFEHQLETAIKDGKAKNTKAVKALLDIESLKSSKNMAGDINKAIEQVKADNDYLFNVEEDIKDKPGTFVRPNGSGKKIEISKDSINAVEDGVERRRLIAENLELFKK